MATGSNLAGPGRESASDPTSLAVAIVHHDRHIRSYLRMLLRGLGVTTVVEAADDAEVSDFCRANNPDVLLVDFDLPRVSVVARMSSFRSIIPDVAVIALSSRADQAAIAEFTAAGVLGNVPIHVIREEVAQAISASLDRLAVTRADLRRTG